MSVAAWRSTGTAPAGSRRSSSIGSRWSTSWTRPVLATRSPRDWPMAIWRTGITSWPASTAMRWALSAAPARNLTSTCHERKRSGRSARPTVPGSSGGVLVKADLGGEDSRWLILEDGFAAALAGTCETLFTTGNGYLGTRGSLEEGHEGALPGTFLRGVFDHHDSAVTDLVKAPDWLTLATVVNGIRLDVTSASVGHHRRMLDMREGAVFRDTVFEDAEGRVADRRRHAHRGETRLRLHLPRRRSGLRPSGVPGGTPPPHRDRIRDLPRAEPYGMAGKVGRLRRHDRRRSRHDPRRTFQHLPAADRGERVRSARQHRGERPVG